MSLSELSLNHDQISWFGERMSENDKGKVIVPNYLFTKLRRLAGDDSITNNEARFWLIQNVYNYEYLTANLKISRRKPFGEQHDQ